MSMARRVMGAVRASVFEITVGDEDVYKRQLI